MQRLCRRHRSRKKAQKYREHAGSSLGTTISAAAFMGLEIQLGDGPMNLPLELQRRLDRRWSARFGMSEQGSRPDLCAAMIARKLEIAISPDGSSRETPTSNPPSAMIDPLGLKPTPN
jgi:hypothetical protein